MHVFHNNQIKLIVIQLHLIALNAQIIAFNVIDLTNVLFVKDTYLKVNVLKISH